MELKKVKTQEDIERFGKYKIELVEYHRQYANRLGLQDQTIEKYSYDRAIINIGKPDHFQFLIIHKDKYVGVVEYQITYSEIDNAKILYIKDLWIKESERGEGIGTQVITQLKKLGYRIELECWYELPSNHFYKELGARKIKTRYMLMSTTHHLTD